MKNYINCGLVMIACACIWYAMQPTKIEHRTRQLESQLDKFEMRVMVGH